MFSGAIASLAIPEAKVVGYTYGDEIQEDLNAYDILVLADVTLPKHLMLEHARKIILIDHHAPTLVEYVTVNFGSFCCDMTMSYSAAFLAWQRFCPGQEMPEVVKLVSAYDVFNKSGEYANWHTALLFQYGLRKKFGLEGMTVQAAKDMLLGEVPFDEIMTLGEDAWAAKREEEKEVFQNSWEVTASDGSKGLAVFSPDMSFLICEDHIEGADFILLMNRVNGGLIRCSFRSKDSGANVQQFAKALGGGGHVHAAGATIGVEVLASILAGNLPV